MSDIGIVSAMTETGTPPKRRRKRNSVGAEQRQKIADRVVKAYNLEVQNGADERNARLQRYAKYRCWTSGTDWPWPDASDVAVPDMLQDSLRIQDTLHNAVMSQRPPIVSRATKKEDEEKTSVIDDLIDHQFFVEQEGEKIVGELVEGFVNDPAVTVFTPWVRERKRTSELRIFDPIPDDRDPKGYFFELVRQVLTGADNYEPTGGGWDWTVTLSDGKKEYVKFYTNETDEVEMVREREVIVYDGPCNIVKDYDDVLYPARSKNLQPPGPSNPGGAPYVIMRDFPVFSEIKSLQKSGYYDLLTTEEITRIETASASPQSENQSSEQKDKMQGKSEQPGSPADKGHKKLTRLMCFDTFDIDGDGLEEDVVFWVLLETKTLMRVRMLSDLNPGEKPRRPFAGNSFLTIGGRYAGWSLLEIMEAGHDAIKVMLDQIINGNDLAIARPGFYRPSGGMNPEELRIEPFTLIPLQNPQQDVVFPQIGDNQSSVSALNLITMLSNWQDKTTAVGDLQFGQVPSGSSSAMRTIGGMSLAMGQGEARPERILRRFFGILAEVFGQMHRLNQAFLPKGKQFKISRVVGPQEDPYRKINGAEDIQGDYQFTFSANAFNTSKAALQRSLENLMRVLINPLSLQAGTVTPETIYRLQHDYARAQGQNADRYLMPPTPEAAQPRIMAEEAISSIMNTEMPVGIPLEFGGPMEHLKKLIDFANSDNFGLLLPNQVSLFRQYLETVRRLAAVQQGQMQLQAAAAQFGQGQNQGQPGAPVQTPPQAPPSGPPQISGPGELMNERLPGAGGGANA